MSAQPDNLFGPAANDSDAQETREWLDALAAVIETGGRERGHFLLEQLLEQARQHGVDMPFSATTAYVNTIDADDEERCPGNLEIEERLRAYMRWNAMAMVVKANRLHPEDGGDLGGHISSFASVATMFGAGFNHFWHAESEHHGGDCLYIQGHSAPGIYARAFMEGRLTEEQLLNFRQEVGGKGLSSYPHPKLMPEFWQFPTVSMGLGPLMGIYQARFLKYLHARGIANTENRKVWVFCGDGEMDEVESLGAIGVAAREKLDNLIFIVNCNLQRLDGPVRGNGKIIQELEAIFRGAGWNVIKVVWGSGWDDLLARDVDGALVNVMNETVDGEYQRYKAEDGAYVREHFFGKDPRAAALVEDWTDEQIWALRRGGLDYRKIYAAYKTATNLTEGPTVILAKTIKGWTLGPDVEGRNATHQIKELTNKQLMVLRSRLHLEETIPAEALEGDKVPPYYRPEPGSEEYEYLMGRRRELNGFLPSRHIRVRSKMTLPGPESFQEVYAGSGKVEASTTTAFTRLLRNLARHEEFGPHVVPIVPDEARTFGMDSLFRELGIYASQGQLYEPVDHAMLLSYHESKDGQILEEGITEAGSTAEWTAAATSYATRGVPMVPFYIFYSMFGFQRVGDLLWAAADSRARGFLLGGTAGRTTLQGEGLQHQDGHSHILASTVPVCEAYDPAFAYEVGTIIEDGIRRMYGSDPEDIYYYITLYNENYTQPPRPEGVAQGIVDGIYRWAEAPENLDQRAAILFSGTANLAARAARDELAEHYGVGAELWSVTSYKRLREEALGVERWNRLHPTAEARTPFVTRTLSGVSGPLVAVTDFMAAVPDQVGRWVPGPFSILGTDGFGRSDSRSALRRFFETDTGHVVFATLSALVKAGELDGSVIDDAIRRYEIDPDLADPAHRH